MAALVLSWPGSAAAHDDLVVAVGAFNGTAASLQALTAYALNCDMPRDTADVVAWAERRAATYRRTVTSVQAAIAAYATALDLIDSVAPSITEKAA